MGPLRQWEKKRERGPLASLLAGSFRGEEKRFGEKRRWAASWAVGPDWARWLGCSIFFLSKSFSFSISIF